MKTRFTPDPYLAVSLLSLLLAAVCAEPAHAASPNSGSASAGVTTIDQAKAVAGGVTSGDAAGFPVTLSQPGSYRLTSNLVVADPNTTAILITSPNITLDLGGFAIAGPVTCTAFPTVCYDPGIGDGVTISFPAANDRAGVTIANGSIRGMGRSGVRAPNHDGVRIERLFVMHSGAHGVALFGGGVVVDSQVSYNGQMGIVGNNLALFNNVVRANSLAGISANVLSVGSGNLIQGHAVNVAPGGMKNLGPNWCDAALCP